MERRAVPAEQRKAVPSHKKRIQLIDQKLATEKFVVQPSNTAQDATDAQFYMATSNGDGTFELLFNIKDGAPSGRTASRHDVEFVCWEDQMFDLGTHA